MGQRSDRWLFAVQNWPRKGMERNVRTVRGEGKRVWDGQKHQKRCSGAPESEGTRVEEGRGEEGRNEKLRLNSGCAWLMTNGVLWTLGEGWDARAVGSV